MFPRIVSVKSVRDYILELEFSDGTRGQIDFHSRIVGRGGVFAPLQNLDYFQRVRVNPVTGTIEWPNEVDLDPDVLYSLVTNKPIEIPELVQN